MPDINFDGNNSTDPNVAHAAQLTVEQLCGWIPNPTERNRIVNSLPTQQRTYADAASHLSRDNPWDGKSDSPLWNCCIKVTGANLKAHKQTIGDCVSHGHGNGMDYLQCVQIATGKVKGEFKVGDKDECFTESLYGAMRKRAGQLSNTDGAVGAWAVDSLKQDGYAIRNGRAYDGQRAKQWGAQGPDESIASEGQNRKLAQYVPVTDIKAALDLLNNGYPISVCSNQGFSMTRDANGICHAQGSWGHCMLCIGMIMVNGNPTFIICQSWGQNVPSGPTIKNMPDNSFGAEQAVFERMLHAQDSYGLCGIPGFPVNDIMFDV